MNERKKQCQWLKPINKYFSYPIVWVGQLFQDLRFLSLHKRKIMLFVPFLASEQLEWTPSGCPCAFILSFPKYAKQGGVSGAC